MNQFVFYIVSILCAVAFVGSPIMAVDSAMTLSHPATRALPAPSTRPIADGRGYFVDPVKGNNDQAGDKDAPWKNLSHAVKQLKPGDTLYLRGGTYFEPLYVAVQGSAEAPITIHAF